MKTTLLRLLLFVALFLGLTFAFPIAEALLWSFVITYIVEPLVSQLLRI